MTKHQLRIFTASLFIIFGILYGMSSANSRSSEIRDLKSRVEDLESKVDELESELEEVRIWRR